MAENENVSKQKTAGAEEIKAVLSSIASNNNAPKISIGDFKGRKLKISKSYYKNGVQKVLQAGTEFDKIPKELKFGKYALSFKESDFEK